MSIKAAMALGAMLLLMVLAVPSEASAQGGVLYATGYNGYGELGDGLASGEYRFGPGMPSSLSNVTAVDAGYYHTLALLANGTVAAWGYNEYGELGDGTKTERTSPVVLSSLANVTAVALGEYHSLALLANGTVESWGYNGYGELGDNGAKPETDTPEPVPGLSGVKAISAGCDDSFALLENGTVEAWGYNEYGELGDGTKTERPAPVKVLGLENVAAISAGCDYAMALLKNGTVEAWGYGGYGELGTGSAKEQPTPAPVPGVSNVKSISAGGYFGLALLANGTVEGTGYNDDGELGDLTDEVRRTPEVLSYPSAVIALGQGEINYDAFVIEGAVGSLSGSGLTFPGQTVGTTSTAQNVTVTNNGPASMSISGDSLSGSGAGAFHKTADSCQGATLTAGATCTIAYAFAPSAAGAAAATLTVSSSATQPLSAITLSGTGVAAAAPVAPSLSALTLSVSAFRAAPSGASAVAASSTTGTFVIYTDSQAATATFVVEQKLHGIIAGSGKSKHCGKPPKHPKKGAKHCTYYKTLGNFTHADAAGTDALRFTGRVAGRTLALGSYRLSASAHSAGGTSTVRTATFKITH